MVAGVYKKKMNKVVRRGDIWFVNLPEGVGSEQQGDRVALVVSNDTGNEKSPTVIVILGTKWNKKDDLQTQFVVSTDYGLKYDTVFMAEQMLRIDKQRLLFYITHVDSFKMQEADKAMSIALGMFAFFNIEYVKALINKINRLDQESLQYPVKNNRRDELLDEVRAYCSKYGYDSKMFLDKYLIFKEVEMCG